ncbi:MAG: cytidylate kinase family protein [Candidatus Diapherotrites archaeon]|nr:cytidylate kinase family protein [Candidatus Diapherotrites archaeon]
MLIIVCGFAGSGKSTLAENLARHFGIPFVHASDVLKQLRSKKPVEIDAKKTEAGKGFWESPDGDAFMKQREKDGSTDRMLDKMLLEIADRGNVVLDSWTMPWLCKKGFKIWLEASPLVRARRVAARDKLEEKTVLGKIIERDKKTASIYTKLYGFSIGNDLSPFHLAINSDRLTEKEVLDIAVQKAAEYYKKNNRK